MQRLRIQAVVGEDTYADACGDVKVVAICEIKPLTPPATLFSP